MKELKLALMGFGNAGQAFAEMLLEKEKEIEAQYQKRVSVVVIVTRSKGCLIEPAGVNLREALENVRAGKVGMAEHRDSQEIVDTADYDVLIELTPLQFASGKIASDHIRGALRRGKHAITANKGPIAWAYRELTVLAQENHCKFLYETTVMDGTPIFNLKRETLRLCKVSGIKGILNSTTNYILCELAKGREKAEIMAEGKKRGFIEADPAADVDGYDAAAKVTALANVLMDAGIDPTEVDRQGIGNITADDIQKAANRGNVIKLICSAFWENGKVKAKVAPEEISRGDFYASITGTSSVVTLHTDLMGTISVVEEEPEVQQTAYGIFSDMLSVLEE